MSNVLDWGLWLALSALITAAGVFLDKYHISKSTKSRLQDYLVHLFFDIEEKKVPDISEAVTYPFLILTSRLGLVGSIFFFIPFSYFAMVSTAYFGRQALGKEVEEGYVHYALNWLNDPNAIFWSSVIGFTFLLGLISTLLVGRVLRQWNANPPKRILIFIRAFLILAGSILIGTLGFMFLGLFAISIIESWESIFEIDLLKVFGISELEEFKRLERSPFFIPIPSTIPLMLDMRYSYVFAIVASFPAFAGVGALCLVNILSVFIKFIRWTLLQILDAASSPNESPFAYAASLISLMVLFTKLVYEVLI